MYETVPPHTDKKKKKEGIKENKNDLSHHLRHEAVKINQTHQFQQLKHEIVKENHYI